MVRTYSAPFRHGDVEQLLHRADVGIVVRHRADIIQPVGMRDDLHVVEAFRQLLDAAMQIAEVRCGLHDSLTVQFQHHPEDAVCTRVLRAHVQ
jgi:hypothetical protein